MNWVLAGYAAIAAALGVLTGAGELVSTYKGDPAKALRSAPGLIYLAFNALIGVVAYQVVRALAATTDPSPTALGELGWAVAAGLGGVAIMRIKFLTVRVGDEQKSIGPGNLIDALLAHFDRQIDRRLALGRCKLVRTQMKGIDFDKAVHYVNVQIDGSLQNLPSEDRELLGIRAAEIAEAELPNREKAMSLGFLVLDLVGEEFLRELFAGTRSDFSENGDAPPPSDR